MDIELELPETWPPLVRASVEEHRELLIAYQQERRRIERLGWDDPQVRIDPPTNPYRAEYDALVSRTEALLCGNRLVGYHCTRLTPAEVDQIRTEGLRALSPDLVRERLDALVTAGELDPKHRRIMLDNPLLRARLSNQQGNRTGLVWLCPNRSSLRDAAGIYRLFRSWGGEVLYAGFEDDASISSVLEGLGRPAIVKCAVQLPSDALHGCRAAQFLSKAVHPQVSHPEPPPAFDWSVKRDLDASEVIDIIRINDARFEDLTGYREWTVRIE